MASYLVSLWNGNECRIALVGAETSDILVAFQTIKDNLGVFFEYSFFIDKQCELRLYPICDNPSYKETFLVSDLIEIKPNDKNSTFYFTKSESK